MRGEEEDTARVAVAAPLAGVERARRREVLDEEDGRRSSEGPASWGIVADGYGAAAPSPTERKAGSKVTTWIR
ncbi:hypothetical protein WMF18_27425 [Sorangium sp. So ce315]|uniref:hypothetical protein n=1 Tax=Sorangium sp. So ce315 TaxID=3133299 RepID=UPI003F5DD7E5